MAHDVSPPPGLLESFLPEARRAAVAAGASLPTRVSGAGLFADISGFTALAEALVAEHGRQRGAEEVDTSLNRVYEALVGDLASYGGEVLYFSGDAITCWLDGDDGARAVRCALDMQNSMRTISEVAASRHDVTLSIKVAVAVGSASRFVVGDPQHQRMDVLAGRLIDHLAAAEGLAERGDVIADQSVVERLGDDLVCSETRHDPASGRLGGVVERLLAIPATVPVGALASIPLDVVSEWILPEVFSRLVVGGGDFLGELRTAHPIFVRFGGFDFDDDADVSTRVDAFIRDVQWALARYDGILLGITVGDKGAYLNAVVGAPHSHEDDALRAVAAAVEIRDLCRSSHGLESQIGVSVGQIYSGTYGHTDRRTFTVLGDPTNLAARLMTAAPPGEVYVLGEVADAVEDRFSWSEERLLTLKGKAAPVRARAPIIARVQPVSRVTRFELPMFGRDREFATALDLMDRAQDGERHVLTVMADAGVGKSRFIAEVLREADRREIPIAYGQAESLATSSSYVVWRGVWRRLFGLDEELSDQAQAHDLERVLAAIEPSLARRAPLLAPVVSVDIPDNDFVRQFDAKLRKASMESLLAEVLAARLATSPQIIVLEDLQWIDQPSIDLLVHLVRRTNGLGALFLISHRLEPAASTPPELEALDGRTDILLSELSAADVRSVVAAKVSQIFGVGTASSSELVDLVIDRAQGNPFYAEEIINYVHRLGLDPGDPAAVSSLSLPDNLQAIVLGRIDSLDERPRQAVKVGSVVGREFGATLLGVAHSTLGSATDVAEHLGVARQADLITTINEEFEDWYFRHAITREVAYESIPYSVRRTLHERIGDHLAVTDAAVALDLLAHHYWHSGNAEKQRVYLRLAGDAARRTYANQAAIEHYRRLAEIVVGMDRAEALLDLSGVYELVGNWGDARSRALEARELSVAVGAEAMTGWCDVALAEIGRKQGQLSEAEVLLTHAQAEFAALGDEAGVARALHLRGTIAAQHGDYVTSRDHYEQSRVLRERSGDMAGLAGLLSNLGVIAEYEGEYDDATSFHREALELRRQIGDRWAIAVSHTNLGMISIHQSRYAEARELFEEALRLNVAVGDEWMVAISRNNLGNALRDLGDHDEARSHYLASLQAYRTYGDRWALTFLFEDLAVLLAAHDSVAALQLLGVADRWREEIDVPRPGPLERELDERLAPHLAGRSTDDSALARAHGRSWSDAEAFEFAERSCAVDASTDLLP